MSNIETCLQCQSLFTGKFPESDSPRKKHHASMRDVQVAAGDGCFICTGIIGVLDVEAIPVVPGDYYIEMSAEGKITGEWSLKVRWSRSDDVQTWFSPFYFIPSQGEHRFLSIETPLSRRASSKSLALDLGSTEAGEVSGSSAKTILLQKWMNKCLQTHAVCQRLLKRYWPTRLIDVGTVAAYECRLCITEQKETQGPYATLSHCWGDAVLTKLLLNNFDDMIVSIDEGNLPLTFREAIATVRELGIRYIWIDSLCIIQDSVVDWQRESASMTQVYRNAICCLAATGAQDSTQGLYLARDSPQVPQRITSSWTNQPNATYQAVNPSVSGLMVLEPLGPLSHRAWCYQELRLSRRIIHFTKEQIIWECQETRAYELLPFGTHKYDHDRNTIRHNLQRNMFGQDGTTSSVDGITPHEFWITMVQEYSVKKLARSSDRLIALSGLSRLLQKSMGSEYVAGLWRKQFELHLLWRVTEKREARPENRGPSWSWAALDTGVWYGPFRFPQKFQDYQSLVQILDVQVQHVTDDTYGQARSGIATLQGRVCTFGRGIFAEELQFLNPLARILWDTRSDEADSAAGHVIYWMPVYARQSFVLLDGLLLRKIDGMEQDYRRAGKLVCYDAVDESAGRKAYSQFWDAFFTFPKGVIRIH
jgi:hypothetical protein